MFSNLLLRLGHLIQFVMASALLTFSFLIQREIIAAYASLPGLASVIAALLVVSRVLAIGYRQSYSTPFFSINILLMPFRLVLLSLALFCSVSFFFTHLESIPAEAWRWSIRIDLLARMQAEWVMGEAIFLALLLELALAVTLGCLARAYAPLLRTEQDYRLHRRLRLAQVDNELRLARVADHALRKQVRTGCDRIERRLDQAAADAMAGKLAGSVIKQDS